MADKTEIELKAAMARISGIERTLEALKKPMQDSSGLNGTVNKLVERITKLEASLALKADKKTSEQLEQAQAAKAQAQFKQQAAEIEAVDKKMAKQLNTQNEKLKADLDKMRIETRLSVLEAQMKAALTK